ncbi:MAG: hypothetical protein FD147_303 [Chloroflexi bacterium]|nr:MAG: hypothetical protein FD147_303 [Chloroflexota bacterium]
MPAPAIGKDCHIILSHPDIDSGAGYGFLLAEDQSIKSGGIQMTREVDSGGATRLWLHFDVLLANRALNPDGSFRAYTRAQDYAKLCQFLSKRADVTITSPAGAVLSLGAVGWTADERHLPGSALIKCQFNNVGVYWPPVDPAVLMLSFWDGSLTWATSYWR